MRILIYFLLTSFTIQISIKQLPIAKCHKGYFIHPKTKKCTKIPSLPCSETLKKNHFHYYKCKSAEIFDCPIKKCKRPGILFKKICMCVSNFTKRKIKTNFYYRRKPKRFIRLYNPYLGVNSNVKRCTKGYSIHGNTCQKSNLQIHCRSSCKSGFEVLFKNCICYLKPKCPILQCKEDFDLEGCQCKKNLNKIKMKIAMIKKILRDVKQKKRYNKGRGIYIRVGFIVSFLRKFKFFEFF
jgi:hypothetical protein